MLNSRRPHDCLCLQESEMIVVSLLGPPDAITTRHATSSPLKRPLTDRLSPRFGAQPAESLLLPLRTKVRRRRGHPHAASSCPSPATQNACPEEQAGAPAQGPAPQLHGRVPGGCPLDLLRIPLRELQEPGEQHFLRQKGDQIVGIPEWLDS